MPPVTFTRATRTHNRRTAKRILGSDPRSLKTVRERELSRFASDKARVIWCLHCGKHSNHFPLISPLDTLWRGRENIPPRFQLQLRWVQTREK